jgi:hypothetical protein
MIVLIALLTNVSIPIISTGEELVELQKKLFLVIYKLMFIVEDLNERPT